MNSDARTSEQEPNAGFYGPPMWKIVLVVLIGMALVWVMNGGI